MRGQPPAVALAQDTVKSVQQRTPSARLNCSVPSAAPRRAAATRQQAHSDTETGSDSLQNDHSCGEGPDSSSGLAPTPPRNGKRKMQTRNGGATSPRSQIKELTSAPSQTGCRGDNSLGELTKKFLVLIEDAPNGVLDLNKVAVTLKVKKRRIYDITNVLEGVGLIEKKAKNAIQWKGAAASASSQADPEAERLQQDIAALQVHDKALDEQISVLTDAVKAMMEAEANIPLLYVTDDDVTSLPCFANDVVFAVKAPAGTTLQMPDPEDVAAADGVEKLRMELHSVEGPVDVYIVQQPPSLSGINADTGEPQTSWPQELSQQQHQPSQHSAGGATEPAPASCLGMADTSGAVPPAGEGRTLRPRRPLPGSPATDTDLCSPARQAQQRRPNLPAANSFRTPEAPHHSGRQSLQLNLHTPTPALKQEQPGPSAGPSAARKGEPPVMQMFKEFCAQPMMPGVSPITMFTSLNPLACSNMDMNSWYDHEEPNPPLYFHDDISIYDDAAGMESSVFKT